MELDFQGTLLLKCEGTETQAGSHHLVSLRGRSLPWQQTTFLEASVEKTAMGCYAGWAMEAEV